MAAALIRVRERERLLAAGRTGERGRLQTTVLIPPPRPPAEKDISLTCAQPELPWEYGTESKEREEEEGEEGMGDISGDLFAL